MNSLELKSLYVDSPLLLQLCRTLEFHSVLKFTYMVRKPSVHLRSQSNTLNIA